MKLVEWNVAKYHAGKPQKEIEGGEVAFLGQEGERFIIRFDAQTNSIKVFKSTPHGIDAIQITPCASKSDTY